MGKRDCFLCHASLGMMSLKTRKDNLLSAGIVLPEGFTDYDVLCNECFKSKKREAKVDIDFSKQMLQERFKDLHRRTPEYKKLWNKNGVIQFKNEHIAILKRVWAHQVEFIIAFDDLTKEGYRLMVMDEGKPAGKGGEGAGISSFFYFQKMEYVK